MAAGGPNTAAGAKTAPYQRPVAQNRRNQFDYFYGEENEPTSLAAQTANPSALGLLAFGFTTALLQGANTHWTEYSTTNSTEYITVAYAFFYGGLVQLLAGMWEFRRNNMFAATAFSSYGAFWMGFGLYVVLTSADVIPATGVHGAQMWLSLWGIFTFFYFLVSLGTNIALMVLFLFLSIVFFLLAAGQQNTHCMMAAGYIGIFVAAVAWYIAFAELINEVWFHGRNIMPLGASPFFKKEKTTGHGTPADMGPGTV
jgi:hypothetical protein